MHVPYNLQEYIPWVWNWLILIVDELGAWKHDSHKNSRNSDHSWERHVNKCENLKTHVYTWALLLSPIRIPENWSWTCVSH
jgi:hypothetical protein